MPIDRLRSWFDIGDDPEMCEASPADAVKAGIRDRYDFFLQRYA